MSNLTDDQLAEQLVEALTLTRELVCGMTGPHGGFSINDYYGRRLSSGRFSSTVRWGWYSHWWQTKNTDSYDIEYRNTEGKLHRIYGPAYINEKYNIEMWFKDGLLHRLGGPAVTHKNCKMWFRDDLPHRLDGPAIISDRSPKEYYIHGSKLSPKEYKKEIARRVRKGLIK